MTGMRFRVMRRERNSRRTYDVSVVLLHDTNALDVTVEMLPELIEELRKLGADMLPITRTSSVIQHIDAGSVK